MDPTLMVAAFVMASSLVMLIALLMSGHHGRVAERLQGLSVPVGGEPIPDDMMARLTTKVIPRIAIPLVPQDQEEQGRLRVRLIQAGYYGEQAIPIFLGMKMAFIFLPLIAGIAAGFSGLVPLFNGVLGGAMGGIVGFLLPSWWLLHRKQTRQQAVRTALPDAIDMIVVCAQAGLSLDAAIQRVGSELRLAHQLLATELRIVNRTTEMGMGMPEALSQLAGRFDLEELRYLATIVREAENFGTSVVKSLQVHAETLRTQRLQRAEEAARKASVKMLFPTLLFIFPVIFLVVLAPSVIHIMELLNEVVGQQ